MIGKQYNGAVKIHAHHNLLQLFLINSGTTELRVNDDTIQVAGPSFIIIPKNMAHGFNHLGDVNGWIISLSDIYIEHMVQTDVNILTAIDVFQLTPLDEDLPTSMSIYNAAQNCVDEYHSNLPGRVLMMQTLVGQIMVNLFRLKKATVFQQAPAPDTSSALLFRRFKQNIKASYSYKKTVTQYADDLKITSGYLNNICKSVSNQRPKDIIIDYFLIEARFLLLDPEKSINQVCYLL